ncbi:MAG: DUF2953 domain-containing protein [Oscillospiraceae bacterium]|nr:DUF2953 domain-containing protein [Oscillospiraceae bacterium]
MTALWVIAGIIALLILLFWVVMLSSAVAKVEYHGDFRAKVKFWGITLFDSREPERTIAFFEKLSKPKKPRKAPKFHKAEPSVQKREASAEHPKQPEKQSLADKMFKRAGLDKIANDLKRANVRSFDFEMFKLIYDSVNSPIRGFIKKIRVTDLRLLCVIATGDAMKTALTYGLQSAAVSSGVAWIDSILVLKVKKISVTADFAKEKGEIDMFCKVKVRVLDAAVCGVKLLWNNRDIIKNTMNTVKGNKHGNKSKTKRKSKPVGGAHVNVNGEN